MARQLFGDRLARLLFGADFDIGQREPTMFGSGPDRGVWGGEVGIGEAAGVNADHSRPDFSAKIHRDTARRAEMQRNRTARFAGSDERSGLTIDGFDLAVIE